VDGNRATGITAYLANGYRPSNGAWIATWIRQIPCLKSYRLFLEEAWIEMRENTPSLSMNQYRLLTGGVD
jgi:hypothetical protein